MKEELAKAFSNEPGGVFVKGEKYIFIKREGDFIVLRKNTDGMVISKTNQGNWWKPNVFSIMHRYLSFVQAYIISIGVNQKPEMLVDATAKMGEYLKGLGY